MINPELLSILICPESHRRLAPADDQLVGRLNQAIRAGRIVNNTGQAVEEPIQGGLVRDDGKLLYPVVDDIPNLLVDRAIPLAQL